MHLGKKILIFNLNGRGGMLHYASQFSNALSKHADIRVVVPSYADTSLYDTSIRLWKIRTNPTLLSFLFDSVNLVAHMRLIREIARFRPDVIHILDNHPWYVMYAMVGRMFGVKIYVTQHDPFPHSGERSGLFHRVAIWVNARLRQLADRLIVHGESMREQVIEKYGIAAEKVIATYHGSFDAFDPGSGNVEKKDGKTLLFFGRIVAYKGLHTLLEALGMLEKEGVDYHAIIAGDGDMRSYESAINGISKKHLTIENRFIRDDEIEKFFLRASFVVLPYQDATASGVIPLAYRFHLPVIATRVGVLPDYVEDGKTGILIEKGDASALKEAIKNLLHDPQKTRQLGVNGYIFQKEQLSWDGIVAHIYHVK